jgi:hypothetical protein
LNLLFAPQVPAHTASPFLRIEPLAIKPFAREVGVGGVSETEEDIMPPYGMTAIEKEIVRDDIIFSKHVVGRHCDLMQPVAIDPAAR